MTSIMPPETETEEVVHDKHFPLGCPDEIRNLYVTKRGKPSKSKGDSKPVVSIYPHYPLSALELQDFHYGTKEEPAHVTKLKAKYPDYFEAALDTLYPPSSEKSLREILDEDKSSEDTLYKLDMALNGPRQKVKRYESKMANGIDKIQINPSRENFEWLLETVAAARYDTWDVKLALDEVFGGWEPPVYTINDADFDVSDEDKESDKINIIEGEVDDDFLKQINEKFGDEK